MKTYLDRLAKRIEELLPENISKNSDTIFLVAMGAFLILFSFKNTKMDLYYPPHPAIFLIPALVVATIIRIIGQLRDRRRIIAGIVVISLYCITFLLNRTEHGNYSNLIYIGLLTAGCIGINYEKVLRVWCMVVGLIIAITFCAASVGAAENLVYYAGGWRHQIRGSLGIIYPTDCATWVLFFLMILWVAYKKIPTWIMLIMAGGSAFFATSYCGSTASFICSLIFAIAVIYEVIERRVIEKHTITDIIILILAPLLSILMFAMIFLYGRGGRISYVFNEKLHGRIKLGWEAIQKYGIRPFGVNFQMEGFGGKLVHDLSKYNFLDCSYVNILVRYGFVIFIMIMAMWLYIEWRAVKMGDRRMLFVMAVISLHSFAEHHLVEVIYNPIIIMALASFVPVACDNQDREIGSSIKNRIYTWFRENARILVGLVVIAIVISILPYCFSIIRTVTDLTMKTSGKPRISISLLLSVILLGIIFVLLYGATNIAKHIARRGAVCILGAFISAVITLISCEVYIYAKNETYIASFEAEKSAIEHIIKVSTHPVYIDTVPEIYRQNYPTLKSSVFAGADLARYPRGTVITDALTDPDCFFNRGYLMTQISDKTVIYSNDEPVLKELERAGWHITGYYSVIRKAQVIDDDSAIIEDLTEGRYVYTAELELISLGSDTGDKIGEIRVITSETSNANGAEPLYLSDFYNGKAHKSIVCNIMDSPEVKITMECTDGFAVKMISADYAESYDIDVHSFYDDNYQIIRSEFYDATGSRIARGDGVSALEYEYDNLGNACVIRYYGIDDKPLIIGSGYAEIHKVYDDLRRVVSESYYGIDGKPKTVSSGQASDERILDVRGNIIIQRYYGLDGKPVLLDAGYAEIHRLFDDKGHIVREEYYDLQGNPLVLRDGYAAIKWDYDDNDNVIFTGYYNAEGKPTIVSLGYSEIHRKFDDTGNTLEESYYGMDGHLMMIKKGYAMIRWEYDSVGRVLEESYYDTQGKPVALVSGQAYDTREYDSAGNCVIQKYYAADGAPVMIENGYAEIHRDYNDKKQLIRETYFDTSGESMVLKAGNSYTEYEYDEYGNTIGVNFFDALGNSVMINRGYSAVRKYYDDRKHLYREEYLGLNYEPVLNALGYHAIERKYDKADHVISEEYLDGTGNPVNSVLGYATVENVYNEEGCLTLKKYKDTKGKASADKVSQLSEIHYEYDDMGHIVREEYFGPDGKPAENYKGYAIIDKSYDEDGLIAECSYYDTDGMPTSCSSGYARITYEYDQSGLEVAEWYFDTKGNPVTCTGGYYGLLKEYDERGMVSSKTMVDTEERPMISTSLYSRSDTEYDERGNETSTSYFGKDGEPVYTNSGYARIEKCYDEWGRMIREEYFDVDGKPVTDSRGIAFFEREYDNRDLILRDIYFDPNGIVSDNIWGVSEYRMKYGDTNLLIREELNNAAGNRQETAGYVAAVYEYNDKGLLYRERYVNGKDATVMIGAGYAMVEYEYDDLRNRISKRYLDASGHYVDSTSGYGGVISEYDGSECVRESFVDSKGAFIDIASGYCTIQKEYDIDRNLVSIIYLDKNDDPIINSDVGYSVVKYEYDEYRNLIGEYYYDTMGNPIVAANGCRYIQSVYDKDRNVILQYRK